MKKRPQVEQIISVLIIFILLLQLSGCYSTRVISLSDIHASDKYYVQSKKSTYPVLSNVDISNGVLSGKLDYGKRNYGKEIVNHIFVMSDSLIKINNDLISIPVNGISKIEQKVPDPAKTLTLTTVIIIGGIAVGVAAVAITVILIKDMAEVADYCFSW
jgi:hypothetical protein